MDAIDNRSSDKRVELTVMHKAFENVELLEPYADDSYLVNLGPGESAVIVKRQIDMLEETAISLGMRKRILQA